MPRMTDAATPKLDVDLVVSVARAALMDVAAKDNLYLRPQTISKAVQTRALRGVRAVEAFVRRVLILLALQFEHEIEVDMTARPYPKKRRKKTPRLTSIGPGSLRVFGSDADFPDVLKHRKISPWDTPPDPATIMPGPVPSAPILARLERAALILSTAEARAHRLAFALARKRHGPLTPPLPDYLPNRLGTEFTAIYKSLGYSVYELSRHRPPAQRPRPPPRPRIRRL